MDKPANRTPHFNQLERTQYQQTQRNLNEPTQECRVGAWFDSALWDPAQLRQRVAFALSEIFVVSDRDANLTGILKRWPITMIYCSMEHLVSTSTYSEA